MELFQGHPKLFVVAGPNGAGKTTYVFSTIERLAGSAEFVNLDEIARGLSPLRPAAARQRAARVALEMTRNLIVQRKIFTLETTLAGKTHLRTLHSAREAGFKIILLYFCPPAVEVCLSRVARRVSEGGHDVPEDDIRRRFVRSLHNLPLYARLSDLWRMFDVSRLPVRVAAEGRAGCVSVTFDTSGVAADAGTWVGSLPACAESD